MLATLRRRTPLIMTVAALLLAVMASAVFAGDPTGGETLAADPSAPFTFIWLMICGILVFFMQAGFLLVEAGFAKAKNTVNILTKNFMDFSIGGLAFFFCLSQFPPPFFYKVRQFLQLPLAFLLCFGPFFIRIGKIGKVCAGVLSKTISPNL